MMIVILLATFCQSLNCILYIFQCRAKEVNEKMRKAAANSKWNSFLFFNWKLKIESNDEHHWIVSQVRKMEISEHNEPKNVSCLQIHFLPSFPFLGSFLWFGIDTFVKCNRNCMQKKSRMDFQSSIEDNRRRCIKYTKVPSNFLYH